MAKQKLTAELGLNTDKYDKGLKHAEKGTSKFGQGLSALAKTMAAAFSVGVLANFGKQAVQLASQIEGVRTAFDRLAAPGLLQGLRNATRGTVTDLQLMQKAVQANNFKIPLSQLATYFDFATKRAIQTGESVDYLVDSIITGIGRKSVLVMDNLGISAVELQNEIGKTGDFATAAGVIVQRELAAMGDVADTTATQIASIGAAFENLKTGLGVKISESSFFQGVTKWVNNVGKFLQLPTIGLGAAIYGATFEADEFNAKLDESNKLIAKNAQVLQKQKEQLAGISQLKGMKAMNEPVSKIGNIPGLSGLPGFEQPDDVLSQGPQYLGEMTKALSEQQEQLLTLADTFAGFFSGVNLGFQGMIDGIMTGLKRLVMDLIAKAAILSLLSAITGTPLTGNLFKSILPGGLGNMIGGGIKGTPAGMATAVGSSMELSATIKGQDIFLSNKRYGEGLNSAT